VIFRIKRSEIMAKHHLKLATLAHAGPGKPTTPTKAAAPSGDNDHRKLVSDEDIRLCAYQKWEAAGKPAGDGVRFWLEAEQELMHSKNEEFVQESGWHGYHEHEWQEAEKTVKESNVNVDSHYRDNNRMFQSHGERGHRHGGSG
jgi:hypothetical protein